MNQKIRNVVKKIQISNSTSNLPRREAYRRWSHPQEREGHAPFSIDSSTGDSVFA